MKKSISLVLAIIMLFSILNVSTLAAGIATPKVKATNTLSGVSVTWNKVSGASKYVVYKRLGTSSTWDIISTTTGTSYEDKGTLTAGKYYVYSVKAYNSAGTPSDYVKANTATVQRVIAPYTKASNALDGINVTWGKVAGANKYVVLRRIGTESTWKTLCTTTGTSFVDKNVKAGIYYIYSIRAVNGTGHSAYDVNKRITVQRVVAPYTKAVNAVNGINVSWGKVTGANKYVVLRRIGTESTWKTLCTTTSTSFLDGSVKPGIYYLYSIRAVNGTGYSAYDVNKRITVQRILTPTAKAVNKSNGVQISWNAVTSATKYSVYRRLGGTSNWVCVGTTTGTTLLDKNVANGNYYAYSIRAINGTGYSAYDSSRCVAIKATKVRVTFSSEIGMVNGKIYAVDNVGRVKDENGYYTEYSSNPVISRLPIQKGKYLSEFCVYDGYIYYTMGGNGDPWCTYYLYRCKLDFTGHELLLVTESMDEVEYDENHLCPIRMSFAIVDNKLYSTDCSSRTEYKKQCIDLNTLKVTYGNLPQEIVTGYSDSETLYTKVFDDKTVTADCKNNTIKVKSGTQTRTVSMTYPTDSYFGGIYGYVNDWVYYSVDLSYIDGFPSYSSILYRTRISDGRTEIVDKCMAGGGSNYFHR